MHTANTFRGFAPLTMHFQVRNLSSIAYTAPGKQLTNVVGSKSLPGEPRWMAPQEYAHVIDKAKLVDSDFTAREVALSFTRPMPLVIDELETDDHQRMTFPAFLEALAHVAEMKTMHGGARGLHDASRRDLLAGDSARSQATEGEGGTEGATEDKPPSGRAKDKRKTLRREKSKKASGKKIVDASGVLLLHAKLPMVLSAVASLAKPNLAKQAPPNVLEILNKIVKK